MIPSSFQITFKKPNDKRTFRATIEVISQTTHIIKFTVKAGKREMSMEKYLFRQGDQWKVTGKNFEMYIGDRNAIALICNIQAAIDSYFNRIK